MSETSNTAGAIKLPPGVKVGAGRETSQLNAQGAVVQGMVWPISLPDGTNSSVFIADSDLHNTAKVTEIITSKVRALMAVTG